MKFFQVEFKRPSSNSLLRRDDAVNNEKLDNHVAPFHFAPLLCGPGSSSRSSFCCLIFTRGTRGNFLLTTEGRKLSDNRGLTDIPQIFGGTFVEPLSRRFHSLNVQTRSAHKKSHTTRRRIYRARK